MNKIIVLDIETTGFLDKGGLIVEIGAVLLDMPSGKYIKHIDTLVKEDGLNKRDHADSWIFWNSDLHFDDVLQANPLPVEDIQKLFRKFPVVSWNTAFDMPFLASRGLRFQELQCPMKGSTDFFCIPGKTSGWRGYKWPKVEEAWELLFPDKPYTEAHRALDDAIHEAKIIHELYKREIWKPLLK